MKTVIFPGTFDPVTFGHLDLLTRAARLADKVIVAVALNDSKKTLFSIDERCALLRQASADIGNVEIVPFCGLLADFAKKNEAVALVRGIRGSGDVDYEMQLSHLNKVLDPQLETILLVASSRSSFISSTVVKEVFKHGGDIRQFAPLIVLQALREKQQDQK
ncbi:pantetheine-phosphate adenylyltransferase [Psychromonas sp. CNPT3]|uniref:pantetheine-phosphate adenylyltransferase n=1 Tax=Psychromonas sp. CNPT3 TaxID=314282 RepID=UPI00006E50AF|nr:pantetheine-phosphate adenylyltransferase [Psychromonas sp. CNPT3]AGH80011.1 pantetheine-phosphate adenylyltransferase [Psychromonas sp. CNPT3]